MWRTNEGVRSLQGAEAALFALAARQVLMDLDMAWGDFEGEDGEFSCDITSGGFTEYDNLSLRQKTHITHSVVLGLLSAERPPVELSAANEAAIATIFGRMGVVKDFSPKNLRHWLAQAADEDLFEREPPEPAFTIDDCAEVADELRDRILWDLDYAMTDLMDLSPEEKSQRFSLLGIAPAYFEHTPPEPAPRQCEALLTEAFAATDFSVVAEEEPI